MNYGPEHIQSLRQCIRSIRFWQFISILILTNLFNTFFGNSFKTFGSSFGNIDDSVLTWAASFGAICSSLSRVIFGKFLDSMGFKKLYFVLLAIQLTTCIAAYTCVKSVVIFFACILANNVCLGASFTCLTTGCAKVFGTKWGA